MAVFLPTMYSGGCASLMGKFDTRILISVGVVWLAAVSLLRVGWTVDAGFWTLALPQVLQGFGMPFFFICLMGLAMSGIPQTETTSAAGIIAFMRTLSGAIGTAVATTAWDQSSRTSRSELVSSLNDPQGAIASMQTHGMTADQARGVLDRLVDVQASTIGASHVYMYSSVAFLIAAGLVWISPASFGRPEMAGGH